MPVLLYTLVDSSLPAALWVGNESKLKMGFILFKILAVMMTYV
jgi:hypothetical protein